MVELIFLGIIVYLIRQVVRYQKLKANAFSKDEVRKAAAEQAKKMRYRSPVINCDYCGCSIDTKTQKVCPHCGAPFDKDDEWTARFDVKDDFVERSTRSIINQREQKADIEGKKILKKIRRTVIAVVSVIVIILALGGIISYTSYKKSFRTNEELNDKSYYHFVDAGYTNKGSGMIYDDGAVSVTINGYYFDEDNSRVKIGLLVENKLNKNVKIYLHCNSVNGVSTSNDQILFYDLFKKNSTTQIYESMYHFEGTAISEMVFDVVKVRTEDLDYNKEVKYPITVSTTAEQTELSDISDTLEIFSNDKVTVYARPDDEDEDKDSFYIYIKNKTDVGFYVSDNGFVVDNNLVSTYGLYKSYLAPGYRFDSRRIYPQDDEMLLKGKDISLSLSFDCEDNPSLSFATAFINISELFRK